VSDHLVGLQVSIEEEVAGLDLIEHGEASYEWPGVTAGMASSGTAHPNL
jgi:hypothetical protein